MASQYRGSPKAVSAMTLLSRLPNSSCAECYNLLHVYTQGSRQVTHICILAVKEVHIVIIGQVLGAGSTA